MPEEESIQNKVSEYKKKGWYVKTNKHKPYLYHPESGTETPLEFEFPLNESSYAAKSFDKITKEVFMPCKPKLIPARGVEGYFDLNTWEKYEPCTDEKDQGLDCWIEFLERLFPVESERKYIIQFLAHLIQRPEERPSFAIMLTSEQGTGKGVLFSEILYPLLSGQAVQNSDYSTFLGKHSNSLDGTLLCMLDDPKSNHPTTMTKLKSRISEPYIHIERKFESPRTIPTFTRIILASNELTPITLTDNDTRRWYVPFYIKHKVDRYETQSFIKKMLQEISLDAIYHWLNEQSLEGFDHKSPPETKTLRDILYRSKPEIETEIDEFIEEHKVFQWGCLTNALTDTYHTKDIKDYLIRKGFQNKRINMKSSKPTFWFHSDIPIRDVKEEAQSYSAFSF